MSERTNRRDQIVDVSSRLFVEQGYSETSVRQIAEEVGCTEAALYYHFKDKRALLQAVVECNLPDLVAAIHTLDEAESMHDLIHRFVYITASKSESIVAEKLRWVMREFPTFTEDERALIHAKHLEFRRELLRVVRKFAKTEEQADYIVWLLVFVVFGYGQLMVTLGMREVLPFDLDLFAAGLADNLACYE